MRHAQARRLFTGESARQQAIKQRAIQQLAVEGDLVRGMTVEPGRGRQTP